MTTAHLRSLVTPRECRIENKLLYIIYKTVIKDHEKIKNFIKDKTGLKYKSFDIYNVKGSDNISEPHTSIIVEFEEALKCKSGYNLFDYDDNKPFIYRITKGKVKLIKAHCEVKEIITSNKDLKKKKEKEEETDDDNEEEEKKKKKPKRKKAPEVPLAFHDYMDNFPVRQLKEDACQSSGNKVLGMRIEGFLTDLNAELGHDYIFLTLCLVPSQVTPYSAWELIPHLERQVAQLLFDLDDVEYILSAIEIHTSKDDTRKKNRNGITAEKEKEKKDKPDNKEKKTKKSKIVIKKITRDSDSEEEEDDSESPKKETAVGPKEKSSAKIQKENEMKEDSKLLLKDSIELLLTRHNKYVHQLDENTSELGEILRVFRLYDENLKPAVNVENHSIEIAVERAVKFGKTIESLSGRLWSTNYSNPDILPTSIIYEELQKLGGNVVRFKPNKLTGYPHIHMCIARSKNKETGEFDNLNRYYQVLCQPNTIFSDIYIKSSMGKVGKLSGVRSISNTAPCHILSYCLKNSLHSIVHSTLGRAPCTLYNPQKLEKVNKFFDDLLRNSIIIIRGVTPCSSTPLEVKQHREYDRNTQKFINAKERLAAYMKNNNYAINYDEDSITIWTKVNGSKNTWKEIHDNSKLSELIIMFVEKDNYDCLKYKKELSEIMSSKTQTSFPKINIDYRNIEFKDFFLNFAVGTYSKVDPTNPSFYYNPHCTLEEYQNSTFKSPEMWLSIFINSKMMDKNYVPTEIGTRLLIMLYALLNNKKHKDKIIALLGDPDSIKTSIYAILLGIYPQWKIGIVTSSNGFESSTYDNKEILNFDEINARDIGITVDKLKQLIEGDTLQNINKKNQNLRVSRIRSRVIISGNNMDALSKDSYQSCRLRIDHSPLRNSQYNSLDEYQRYVINKYNVDLALSRRITFFPMLSMPKEKIIPNGKNIMIEKETGPIILYLARFNNMVKHYDNLDELHKDIETANLKLATELLETPTD